MTLTVGTSGDAVVNIAGKYVQQRLAGEGQLALCRSDARGKVRDPSMRLTDTARGRLARAAGILTLAALAASAGGAQAMQNGVGITAKKASTGSVDFDPPSSFAQTLPLKGFYLNPETAISFVAGNGAVLGPGAGFGVDGFSAPNFLAFNCKAKNADGSVPALPMVIRFPSPVGAVLMNVATPAPSGGTVTLEGFNIRGTVILRNSVPVTSTMEPVGITTGRPGEIPKRLIASVRVTGPCVLAVDDIATSNAPQD
jgi:hypothetical protein